MPCRRAGLAFDERLGLAGGSDTLFTRALVAAGRLHGLVRRGRGHGRRPRSRATREWVLRRQLRSGNSWSRTALMLCDGRSRRLALRLALTARGVLRLAAGPALWLAGVATRDVARRARGAKVVARGAGLLMGAYGLSYDEYRRA